MMRLSEKERELTRASFHPRLYRRRQAILLEGNECRYYHFVVRGCLRMYKIAPNGNMYIIKFAPENTWITDIDSFYHHNSSLLNIDALEPTAVLQTTMPELISLYTRFDRIFRVLAENELAMLQQRHLQTLGSSAEECYQSSSTPTLN